MAQIYLSLYVGYEGTGRSKSSTRGKVTSSVSHLGFALVGRAPPLSTARLTLWANTQDLNVGYNGTGTLSIRNGGTVSNTNGFLGLGVGSTGTATVNGASSTWSNTNDLSVGYFGTGSLSITGGGLVTNYNANIGASSGSSGTASVDGPGSRWTNNSVLAVGSSGDGHAEHHPRRRGVELHRSHLPKCRVDRLGPDRRPGFAVGRKPRVYDGPRRIRARAR